MSRQLNFIGDIKATTYKCGFFSLMLDWLRLLKIVALDTETNVTDSILSRQLKIISLADEEGQVIWIIEWEYLSEEEKYKLLNILKNKLCIIHNVSFDYSVLKRYGVTLNKVYDTMLAEQILTNGYSSDKGSYGLQAIYLNRFNFDISKQEQLSFSTSPYTDSQIHYCAADVLKLGLLRKIQLQEIKTIDKENNQRYHKGLRKTLWWENEFVKAIADMESTGIKLDKTLWYAIEDSIKPILDVKLQELNNLVIKDFKHILIANNYYSTEDIFTSNIWTSSAKKKLILSKIYDFPITNTAILNLKQYLATFDPDYPHKLPITGSKWNSSPYPMDFTTKFAILKLLILNSENSITALNKILLLKYKDFCIEQGWLIPANTLNLNWASPTQRLNIFRSISLDITSTAKDVLADFISLHPIILLYLDWNEVEYQLKSFGKQFYDKHVELDGKFRTRFTQILATGRLSSTNPNLLNIPRESEHGAYRAALIPDEGFNLIDADYDGQELVITATLSKEKSWQMYLEKGYDLHSKNAELIFGEDWLKETEPDCSYYKLSSDNIPQYKKCNCSGHKIMRNNSKAVSFGSIYGISFIKLAFNLKISKEQAKFILTKFFEVAPAIAVMMKKFGAFAIHNGFIIEPVFGRIRYFDKWKLNVPAEVGSIERAAFNTPIQSSGSAILKIAVVLMRRWIIQNNLTKSVQLLLPYHDEILAQATEEYTEIVKQKLSYYMQLAAKLAGFNIIATAKSGHSWLETH